MGLKRVIDTLPGDRETSAALREVVGYLRDHSGQPIDPHRIVRVTGLTEVRVADLMSALAAGFVIDCDGNPASDPCTFEPDIVLQLEVDRFLRTAGDSADRLQRSVDRFRGRYSGGH
jgi:hypothetical protein